MSETAAEAQEHEIGESTGDGGTVSMPIWLIPALVLAGLAIGVLGEYLVGRVAANAMMAIEGRFQQLYFPEPHGQLGDPPEWLIERRIAMMKNNAVGYGAFSTILVAAIGGLLGIAYSKRNPFTGLLVGGLSGLVAGAVFAPICYYIEDVIRPIDMEGALKAALTLGLMFLSFGIAGAFTALFAGPVQSTGRTLVNGVVAGVLAVVAYILFTIAVFPIGFPESNHPLDAGVRYSLFVCLGLCPVLAAILTLRSHPAKAT